ncbi:hypothetical protein [Actinosynnema sp. NPDC020468]|uniref:hypothetical protein n=1 Tax=Actinosynnema sp. NPDC020468 TaxID=3154488 RepID=UPI0033C62CB3
MTPGGRALTLLAALGAGWITAAAAGLDGVEHSAAYGYFITALLGFGLYASASGIEIAEFRKEFRTIAVAVTLGVLAKTALIAGVLWFAFRADPRYLLLAVAVAQIDPLSVASVLAKSRMSDSAKALLAAWAAFDDPMTVLLTVYLSGFVLADSIGGLDSFGVNLLLNAVLAAGAWGLYRLWRHWSGRPKWHPGRNARVAIRWLALLSVLAIGYVAVKFSLLLGLAVIGLFFRPVSEKYLSRAAEVCVVVATLAVGLVLAGDFDLGLIGVTGGLLLGAAAFASQAVVAWALTLPKRWRGDRVRLALGQQNGLTAIILALLLEPLLEGSIAIVVPAVITVNLLNYGTNAWYDAWSDRRQDGRPGFFTSLLSRLLPTPALAAHPNPPAGGPRPATATRPTVGATRPASATHPATANTTGSTTVNASRPATADRPATAPPSPPRGPHGPPRPHHGAGA